MFERKPEKYVDADLAMGGACPVCLVKMNKIVPGKPEYASVHDGARYLFPGPEQKRMFDENPAAFTPALGGACTVCKVDMHKDVPGKVEHRLVHNNRLYLFPSSRQLGMFKANPNKYADADVALGGNCSVCKVEMGKDVKGKPAFAADYHGKHYLFPGRQQLDMFVANPGKYVKE